jgi:hypothetical protein
LSPRNRLAERERGDAVIAGMDKSGTNEPKEDQSMLLRWLPVSAKWCRSNLGGQRHNADCTTPRLAQFAVAVV